MRQRSRISILLTSFLAFAALACEKDDAYFPTIGDGSSATVVDNELLEASHIHSEEKFEIKDLPVFVSDKYSKSYSMSGTAFFEQNYSVTPLYAFKTAEGGYVGDFYLVDATFSVASEGMYSEPYKVEWKNISTNYVSGFFLTGYQIEITLTDSKGGQAEVLFDQVPAPGTTIGSTTYSSGVSWSFDTALTGGTKGGNLSLGYGCSVSESKTRTISDLSITSNYRRDGRVDYSLSVQNLPNNVNYMPPLISRKTFDFHTSWVWQVPSTAEKDTVSQYKMSVKLSSLNFKLDYYITVSDNAHVENKGKSFSKDFTFNLPVPNRIPVGNLVLENSVKGTYVSDVTFIDASTGKVYNDATESCYSYSQKRKVCLPEGNYKLKFKVDGNDVAPDEIIKLGRGETVTLPSGYYTKAAQ